MFRRWYGSPKATKRPEFMRLLKFLRVSKKDVFCDLGCGYADPCIWVSKKIKLAIGIENNCYRVCKALVNVQKSNNNNIKILKMNIENADYENVSIIYTVIDLAIKDYKKIQRYTKDGTRLVICYPPPYPLKSKYAGDGYYVMTRPFERVNNTNEYARCILNRKKSTIEDVYKWLGRTELKWQISRADWIWKQIH